MDTRLTGRRYSRSSREGDAACRDAGAAFDRRDGQGLRCAQSARWWRPSSTFGCRILDTCRHHTAEKTGESGLAQIKGRAVDTLEINGKDMNDRRQWRRSIQEPCEKQVSRQGRVEEGVRCRQREALAGHWKTKKVCRLAASCPRTVTGNEQDGRRRRQCHHGDVEELAYPAEDVFG